MVAGVRPAPRGPRHRPHGTAPPRAPPKQPKVACLPCPSATAPRQDLAAPAGGWREGCPAPGGAPDAAAAARGARLGYLRRLGIEPPQRCAPAARQWPVGTACAGPAAGACCRRSPLADAPGEGPAATGAEALPRAPAGGSPDRFRLDLLKRLSYSRVWVPLPRRPPRHQTLIVFDWDDTLLCTSWLMLRGSGRVRSRQEQAGNMLRSIAAHVRHLLEQAVQLGRTMIITNAASGWVEQSAAAFIPEALPILQAVRVVSARSEYEPRFPNEVDQWKLQAFLEVQRQLDSQAITNLVSVGDSDFEKEAAHALSRQYTRSLTKTVHFVQNPTPEDLERQLALVAQKFGRIVRSGRDLQVSLDKRPRRAEGQCA